MQRGQWMTCDTGGMQASNSSDIYKRVKRTVHTNEKCPGCHVQVAIHIQHR